MNVWAASASKVSRDEVFTRTCLFSHCACSIASAYRMVHVLHKRAYLGYAKQENRSSVFLFDMFIIFAQEEPKKGMRNGARTDPTKRIFRNIFQEKRSISAVISNRATALKRLNVDGPLHPLSHTPDVIL